MEKTLLQKVMDFPLGSSKRPTALIERLIREQGWSTLHATRVLHEYRRFLYLAAAAGHPVSPPPEIDEAWHTHILFTRNYWDDFCKDILGRPLHHDPDIGLPGDMEKLADWYAKTLASYEQIFHEPPPHDLWPRRTPSSPAHSEPRLPPPPGRPAARTWPSKKLTLPALLLMFGSTATAGTTIAATRSSSSPLQFIIGFAMVAFLILFALIAAGSQARKGARSAHGRGSNAGCGSGWIPGISDGGVGTWAGGDNDPSNSHGHHHSDTSGGHHGGGHACSSGHGGHGCSTAGHGCSGGHGCGSGGCGGH